MRVIRIEYHGIFKNGKAIRKEGKAYVDIDNMIEMIDVPQSEDSWYSFVLEMKFRKYIISWDTYWKIRNLR